MRLSMLFAVPALALALGSTALASSPAPGIIAPGPTRVTKPTYNLATVLKRQGKMGYFEMRYGVSEMNIRTNPGYQMSFMLGDASHGLKPVKGAGNKLLFSVKPGDYSAFTANMRGRGQSITIIGSRIRF